MNKIILMCSAALLVVGIGCQKKDDGGGPGAPVCGPGTVYSAKWAQCVAQTGCPQGFGQHPAQPSMCMFLDTGDFTTTLQCGAGFYLTSKGCLQQGPCPSGSAQHGEMCVAIIRASEFNNPNYGSSGGYMNNSYMMNSGYQGQMHPMGFPNPYMQNMQNPTMMPPVNYQRF